MAIPAHIISEVVQLTKRPDLETTLIPTAIKKATLKEHAADDYPRDFRSVTLATGSTELKFSVDISSALRLRRIHLVQEYNINANAHIDTIRFEKQPVDNIFDNYNAEIYNYYYQVGMVLNLRAIRAVEQLQLFYYQYPDVYTDYSSWIADVYPFAIIEAAASEVFKSTGKDDEAATYRQNKLENRILIAQGEI